MYQSLILKVVSFFYDCKSIRIFSMFYKLSYKKIMFHFYLIKKNFYFLLAISHIFIVESSEQLVKKPFSNNTNDLTHPECPPFV